MNTNLSSISADNRTLVLSVLKKESSTKLTQKLFKSTLLLKIFLSQILKDWK